MGKVVGIAEFKAKCSEFLRELEAGGSPITITNRGKIVGVLNAPSGTARSSTDALWDTKKGSITYAPDYDPSEPADSDWEAKWEVNNPAELYRR